MQVFLAGTAVNVAVVFTDRSGNAMDVATATYRVLGEDGEELQADQELALPAESLTVPAPLNNVAALDFDSIESEDMNAINVRELRTVEFKLTLADGNVVGRKVVYALEPTDILVPGLNSFQTYPEAELAALDMPSMDAWNAADEAARISALVEARLRLTRLQYRDMSRGQSYMAEETLVGDLALVPPREFMSLSSRLRAALAKAQVAEADSLLGGDPEAERRRSGLVHETVGESTQIWRTTKPLDLPVSRKALGYLAGFITLTRTIGRA